MPRPNPTPAAVFIYFVAIADGRAQLELRPRDDQDILVTSQDVTMFGAPLQTRDLVFGVQIRLGAAWSDDAGASTFELGDDENGEIVLYSSLDREPIRMLVRNGALHAFGDSLIVAGFNATHIFDTWSSNSVHNTIFARDELIGSHTMRGACAFGQNTDLQTNGIHNHLQVEIGIDTKMQISDAAQRSVQFRRDASECLLRTSTDDFFFNGDNYTRVLRAIDEAGSRIVELRVNVEESDVSNTSTSRRRRLGLLSNSQYQPQVANHVGKEVRRLLETTGVFPLSTSTKVLRGSNGIAVIVDTAVRAYDMSTTSSTLSNKSMIEAFEARMLGALPNGLRISAVLVPPSNGQAWWYVAHGGSWFTPANWMGTPLSDAKTVRIERTVTVDSGGDASISAHRLEVKGRLVMKPDSKLCIGCNSATTTSTVTTTTTSETIDRPSCSTIPRGFANAGDTVCCPVAIDPWSIRRESSPSTCETQMGDRCRLWGADDLPHCACSFPTPDHPLSTARDPFCCPIERTGTTTRHWFRVGDYGCVSGFGESCTLIEGDGHDTCPP